MVDASDDLAAQLAQLQAELRGLNYAISHDLRAPVRALIGFTQALKAHTSGTLDDSAAHYLARIEQASQRLSVMIDGLLQLSQLSQAEMHYSQVDLSALCAAVIAELERTQPVTAAIHIATDMQVWGDQSLLRIALQALLSNACKLATGANAEVRVTATHSDRHVTLCVRDNGRGFDMRYADRLFVPFQHQHAHNEVNGLGIGLACAQRVVSRHGGTLRADGKLNEFAAFYLTLPALQPGE